jgi:hypothetical protein
MADGQNVLSAIQAAVEAKEAEKEARKVKASVSFSPYLTRSPFESSANPLRLVPSSCLQRARTGGASAAMVPPSHRKTASSSASTNSRNNPPPTLYPSRLGRPASPKHSQTSPVIINHFLLYPSSSCQPSTHDALYISYSSSCPFLLFPSASTGRNRLTHRPAFLSQLFRQQYCLFRLLPCLLRRCVSISGRYLPSFSDRPPLPLLFDFFYRLLCLKRVRLSREQSVQVEASSGAKRCLRRRRRRRSGGSRCTGGSGKGG